MRNIDLSILKKIPELTETAVFSIQPLAPISMISAIPGSYYKTILYPDKQILCGLFENVLGWHISLEDRKMIYKDLERGRKRQKRDFITPQSRSTYKPLLFEYFEVEEIKIESSEGEVLFYNDLWKRAHRRSDALNTHVGGIINLDCRLIKNLYLKKRELSKVEKEQADKELETFLKERLGEIPFFYTIPTNREYISFSGKYYCTCKIDGALKNLLQDNLQKYDLGYLGNSEGWISLELI